MQARPPDEPSARMRRSLLFVPGGDARKLDKAPAVGADVLVLDLEDAVAPERKDDAREQVAAWIRDSAPPGPEIAVRVNAAGAPWHEADLAAVVRAGVHAVMLPKCESAAGVRDVAGALDELERGTGESGSVRILALVESAAGVSQAREIASASPRVDALCFGHADFSLDMGLSEPDPAAGVVHHARCALAIAARAAGVAFVDTVCLATRDESVFRADAALGASLGCEGKLCIHPAQVALANEIFTPTSAQIESARRTVAAWERACAEGRGVIALDGKMVDAPVAAAQERVLERARRAGALQEA